MNRHMDIKGVSRRDFLQTMSLTSIGLLPGMNILAGLVEAPFREDTDKCITSSYRINDYTNLLTLEFYFTNTHSHVDGAGGLYLTARENYLESYMIVRLPQQHIAETFLSVDDLTPRPNFYAQSYISGFSYLVFRIFWDKTPQSRVHVTKQCLLDWNADHFRLVVRQNLKQPIFRIQIPESGGKGTASLPDSGYENQYPLGYRANSDGKLVFSDENFPSAYSRYKKGRRVGPAPITAIEAPYRLILSPQLPDQDNYIFKWSFSITTEPSEKYPWSSELWMAILKAEQKKEPDKPERHGEDREESSADVRESQRINPAPQTDLPPELANEGSNNLKLMIIGSPDYDPDRYSASVSCAGDCMNKDILPNRNDRSDLVDLYIKYGIRATTPQLGFTPMGLSANIELKNKLYQSTLTKGNSLYEWKQSLSFGRDQEVEVARVVVEYPFGLKMLHIRKTKRQTYKGGSILIYREFLMPLEIEKDFTLYNNQNAEGYTKANWKCASPFMKVRFADLAPKQIMTVDAMIDHAKKERDAASLIEMLDDKNGSCAENVLSFWPRTKDGYPLKWAFRITDWHGNEFVQEKEVHVFTSTLGFRCGGDQIVFQEKSLTALEGGIFSDFTDAGKGRLSGTFEEMASDIEKKMEAENKNKWISILQKAEHFDLKKIDYYTDYLQAVLQQTEQKLRAQAPFIEDEVMEEWTIFKRKALEKEDKLLRSIDKVLDYLAEADMEADTSAWITCIEKARRHIIAEINLASSSLIDKVKIEVKQILKDVDQAIALLENRAVKTRLQKFQQAKAEIERFVGKPQLGFEQEYREFLERLPLRFRGMITGSIGQDIDNIRRCINEIRKLEGDVRNRIDFKKSKFGYAVFKVEDELQDLKKVIQQRNSQASQAWEHTYTMLRDLYQKNVNGKISELETEYIILKGNLKTIAGDKGRVFDFFDEYACFPQLHAAAVTAKAINDLVNKEIPCKIRYAEDYFKSQVHDSILNIQDNASKVFAEIKGDAKEYVKSAIKEINKDLGGFVSPELGADYFTYLKDKRKQADETFNRVVGGVTGEAEDIRDRLLGDAEAFGKDAEEWIKGESEELKDAYRAVESQFQAAVAEGRKSVQLLGTEAKQHFEQYRDWAKIEGKEFFKGLEAKIMGAIHLRDIFGEGFELPKLNRTDKKIYYRFVTDRLTPVKIGPFSFINQTSKAPSKLIVYLEKPLDNPKSYTAWTRLSDFTIGIFENRIIAEFDKLEIRSDANTKNNVSVSLGDIKFTQELAFLEAFSKNIKVPGTGLSVNILPKEIDIDFAYTMPGISGGAFTFDNLKFGVGVVIPLPIGSKAAQKPVTAKFSVNAPDDKFVVAVGIWGGKGHFVLETTPKYIRRVDIGIDFGGYLALNLGIAKGEAFLMAGVRYVYSRDNLGETQIELYATLSCGGSVTVFGFITLSVVFLLCLKYEKYQGATILYGTASVTYSIKIGFFRKSFSLTFSRRLHGSERGEQQGDLGYSSPAMQERPLIQNAVYVVNEEEESTDFGRHAAEEAPYDAERPFKKLRDCYSGKQWFNKINVYKF